MCKMYLHAFPNIRSTPHSAQYHANLPKSHFKLVLSIDHISAATARQGPLFTIRAYVKVACILDSLCCHSGTAGTFEVHLLAHHLGYRSWGHPIAADVPHVDENSFGISLVLLLVEPALQYAAVIVCGLHRRHLGHVPPLAGGVVDLDSTLLLVVIFRVPFEVLEVSWERCTVWIRSTQGLRRLERDKLVDICLWESDWGSRRSERKDLQWEDMAQGLGNNDALPLGMVVRRTGKFSRQRC
jgi:hypothetical protein